MRRDVGSYSRPDPGPPATTSKRISHSTVDAERRPGSGMRGPPPLVVIDNFAFSRECIAGALQAACPQAEVVSFENVDAFLRKPSIASAAGLLLINAYGLGPADPLVELGLSALRQSRNLPVILIADFDRPGSMAAAVERGVRGCIPRSASLDIVVPALRLIAAGGTFMPGRTLDERPCPPPSPAPEAKPATVQYGEVQFTPGQLKVLSRVVEGKANKIIAYELAISVSTVKVHMRHIMQKLKATNRTEVAFRMRGAVFHGG